LAYLSHLKEVNKMMWLERFSYLFAVYWMAHVLSLLLVIRYRTRVKNIDLMLDSAKFWCGVVGFICLLKKWYTALLAYALAVYFIAVASVCTSVYQIATYGAYGAWNAGEICKSWKGEHWQKTLLVDSSENWMAICHRNFMRAWCLWLLLSAVMTTLGFIITVSFGGWAKDHLSKDERRVYPEVEE